VGFGVLIDNTIKGLTCLHEMMSRDLIHDVILNEVTHVLQQVCISHWHLLVCATSKIESMVFMVDTKALMYTEACLTYDGISK